MEGFVDIYQHSILPVLSGQQGFAGTHLFTDTNLGKSLLLTLWETQTDMAAFEASGSFQQQLAKFQPVLSAPVTREGFEVWG